MKVAAAHCNPKKQPALNHNDRTNDTAKTITKDLTHLNEYSCSSDEVRQKIDKLYKEAQENFSNYCATKNGLTKAGKPKGLQNFTKKEKCYHEFIYEINENTTMEQCQELTQKIAKLTGFTPLQIVIHRDEIHENAKGEKQTHFHAHAVFFTLDKETGLQLARQEGSLNKQNLSKIQTMASESLKMERGKNRYESGEAQPQYIQDYKDYARFKEQETKLLQEIDRQETELKHKEELIKNAKADLEKREKEHQESLAKLQQRHYETFDELRRQYREKESFVKNLLTLGKHNEKVRQEHKIAEKALESTLTQEETKFKRKIEGIESEKRVEIEKYQAEALKAKNELKESQEMAIKLKAENERLLQAVQTLKKQNQEYERVIRENLAYSEIQKELPDLALKISDENLKRQFAKMQEQQRTQNQGRSL